MIPAPSPDGRRCAVPPERRDERRLVLECEAILNSPVLAASRAVAAGQTRRTGSFHRSRLSTDRQDDTVRLVTTQPPRRSESSRRAILDATLALIRERGLAALTVEGIAARAGV